MLINQTNVRKFALEYAQANRPKFKRVSKEFLIYIEGVVKEKVRNYIHALPSVGQTIK